VSGFNCLCAKFIRNKPSIQPGQLSLAIPVGRHNEYQPNSGVIRFLPHSWGVNAGMAPVWWRVKHLPYWSALEDAHNKVLYKLTFSTKHYTEDINCDHRHHHRVCTSSLEY